MRTANVELFREWLDKESEYQILAVETIRTM